MELIAAVLIAGPLGYYLQPRKRSLIAYLVLWVVIFPIQTWIVLGGSETDEPLYWVLNAAILAGGIGLNILGARLRQRREQGADRAPAHATS